MVTFNELTQNKVLYLEILLIIYAKARNDNDNRYPLKIQYGSRHHLESEKEGRV